MVGWAAFQTQERKFKWLKYKFPIGTLVSHSSGVRKGEEVWNCAHSRTWKGGFNMIRRVSGQFWEMESRMWDRRMGVHREVDGGPFLVCDAL